MIKNATESIGNDNPVDRIARKYDKNVERTAKLADFYTSFIDPRSGDPEVEGILDLVPEVPYGVDEDGRQHFTGMMIGHKRQEVQQGGRYSGGFIQDPFVQVSFAQREAGTDRIWVETFVVSINENPDIADRIERISLLSIVKVSFKNTRLSGRQYDDRKIISLDMVDEMGDVGVVNSGSSSKSATIE